MFRNRVIKIGNRLVGDGQRIFLTGEAGVAHGGSMENAKILIKAAADAGCDGVDIFMTVVEEFYYRNPKGTRDLFDEWHHQSFTLPQRSEEHMDYVRIHREIIEALERRDTAALKHCMTRHTENYLEILYGAVPAEEPKTNA